MGRGQDKCSLLQTSLELQFNWVPSHLKNSDGHTKRQIKKHLYIHIHWLASINGTYTDELGAAESPAHQGDADAPSSSLNTLQTSSPSSSIRCKHAGRAVTSWALSSGFNGFLYTSDWIKSCRVQVMWQFEEGRGERRQRPWAAFLNILQWFRRLWDCGWMFNLQLIIFKCTSTKIKFVEFDC